MIYKFILNCLIEKFALRMADIEGDLTRQTHCGK